MKKIACLVGKILEIFCVLNLAVMSSLVFINVVLRYGFNSSINITEEVSRFMFVWLAFIGAILAFAENSHVNVSVIVEKFSPQKQRIIRLLTDLLMLFCSYLMFSGSWTLFKLNLNNLAPISQLPLGLTYLSAAIAGAFIGILIIVRIISTIALIKGGNQK